MILWMRILSQQRALNHELEQRSWTSGLHIERLTFMKCFDMMVKKDCKLYPVLNVIVMGASHAMTAHILCTIAVHA